MRYIFILYRYNDSDDKNVWEIIGAFDSLNDIVDTLRNNYKLDSTISMLDCDTYEMSGSRKWTKEDDKASFKIERTVHY